MVCHKTKPNKTKQNQSKFHISGFILNIDWWKSRQKITWTQQRETKITYFFWSLSKTVLFCCSYCIGSDVEAGCLQWYSNVNIHSLSLPQVNLSALSCVKCEQVPKWPCAVSLHVGTNIIWDQTNIDWKI